jgi:hypothetical protein
MQRLETEAGVSYEEVDLTNIDAVAAKVFASLQKFAIRQSVETPKDPTFIGVDRRRREALMRAVSASAPGWSPAERQMAAALLDVLWNVPSYERLVGVWGIDGTRASRAIGWLMAKVITAIEDDAPPPA